MAREGRARLRRRVGKDRGRTIQKMREFPANLCPTAVGYRPHLTECMVTNGSFLLHFDSWGDPGDETK